MPMIIRRMLLAGLAVATFASCALVAQQRDVSSNVTVHRIGFLALRPLPQIAPSRSRQNIVCRRYTRHETLLRLEV